MELKTKLPDDVKAKEELFIVSYLTHFDAGKAYLACTPGGNPKTARQNGYKILQRPDVKNRLKERAGALIEKSNVESERLIEELERIAFLDPGDFFEVSSNGEPELNLTKLTPEIRRLLKIKFGIGVTKDGDKVRTYQVETYDKMEAIEKLLKLHQLYRADDSSKQPMAIQVNVNIPIPGQSWRSNQTAGPEPIDADEDL
jgi:hypothetical protein